MCSISNSKENVMGNFMTNWTSEELKVYLLIYCANSDFTESVSELDFIQAKHGRLCLDKMHSEYDQDNDYQSIQKITNTIERLNYTKEDVEYLMYDAKKLFLSDGKFDILEQNLLLGLNHIL